MVLAATVICGASVFTSCKKDEDNSLKLEEKIIGKWIIADINGQPTLTNIKEVFTFASTTKAYISASTAQTPEGGSRWDKQMEADVVIDGNKMTLTSHPFENAILVHEFTITAINGSEFTANHKITTTVNDNVVISREDVVRYVKVTADYAEPILGLWECQELTGIETYNDGNDRLEFFADGTYNYWRKNDAGEWEAVTNREFQNYFVDGTLLATRWKNQGEEELREWWEIASISNGVMNWTALRQKPDGSTVTQTMTWVKVQ